MTKRGNRPKPKTDGSGIPDAPSYLQQTERTWYDHFADACRRSSYAVGIDVDSIALAAQRKAKLDDLRQQFFALDPALHWIHSANGNVKAHPLFAEIRHAERALEVSMTQLFLSPKSRSASRIGGVRDVSQAVDAADDEQAKILKYLA